MRIISKDNDYYDSVQAWGQDQTLVYVRRQEELSMANVANALGLSVADNDERHSFAAMMFNHLGRPLPDYFDQPYFLRRSYFNSNLYLSKYLIGFCGLWVPCLKMEPVTSPYAEEAKTFFFYPGDEGKLEKIRHYFGEDIADKKLKLYRKFLGMKLNPKEDLFHCFKSPILVADVSDNGYARIKASDVVAVKDAKLSDYQFYRYRDAYSAFQDLSQFISGVLGVGQPEIIEISDKDMRDAKGFHDMSFKKRPAN